MIRTSKLTRLSLITLLTLTYSIGSVRAQDVHFTQFQAAPLVVNPAFTGGFSGQWRAAAIYRDQWRSVTVPFRTFAVSFDAPIIQDLTVDDYLAGGLQVYNDRAGDGNLSNTSVFGSLAYHKFLGANVDKALSVGFQGGYSQKSIDLSRLYFGDEFNNGIYQQGTSAEFPGLNNRVSYFTFNAGASWSHSVNENIGYTLGIGMMNINQPQESLRRKKNSEVGLAARYTAQAGVVAYFTDNFSVRPGILYQSQASATELIAGSEFNFVVGDAEVRSAATAVFAGLWYRSNDALMVTTGLDFKGTRIGFSYDYNNSSLKSASGGNGGFEISVRYIAPSPIDYARRLIYPCSRF